MNSGGESFPGEILSVGFSSKSANIALIVNAFDRICGPSIVDNADMAGVAWWKDQGVPYRNEMGYTGIPYDYSRNSLWLDDDSTGWGASYGNLEDKIIPGNSFDFTFTHGEAILSAGFSYISISDETFCDPGFDSAPYNFIDIILGEEKTTPGIKFPEQRDFEIYTPEMKSKLEEVTGNGTDIFLSGAYIGTDFIVSDDTVARNFAQDVLHFTWRTDHAVKNGEFYATDYANGIMDGTWTFNTSYHPEIYRVESPDAIEPHGEGAMTALRYGENNASAGVLYRGSYKSVILGFPFETIIDQEQRSDLMKQIIDFFKN